MTTTSTSNPNYVEQVQTNIPAWMQKYAAQLLGQTFGDTGPDGTFVPGLISQGYQPYMVPKRDAQGNIVEDRKKFPEGGLAIICMRLSHGFMELR